MKVLKNKYCYWPSTFIVRTLRKEQHKNNGRRKKNVGERRRKSHMVDSERGVCKPVVRSAN